MATPEEERAQNEERKNKSKSFIDTLASWFGKKANDKGEPEPPAKPYLEEKAPTEKIPPQAQEQAIDVEESRAKKSTQLSELVKLLDDPKEKDGDLKPSNLIKVAKDVLKEIADKSSGQEASMLAHVQEVPVPDSLALKFARLTAQMGGREALSNPAHEAEKKVREALEIFVGEGSKDTESVNFVKNLANKLQKDQKFSEVFVQEELPQLLEQYNLTQSEKESLIREASASLPPPKDDEDEKLAAARTKKGGKGDVAGRIATMKERIRRANNGLSEEDREKYSRLIEEGKLEEWEAVPDSNEVRKFKEGDKDTGERGLLDNYSTEDQARLELGLLSITPSRMREILSEDVLPKPHPEYYEEQRIQQEAPWELIKRQQKYEAKVKELVDKWVKQEITAGTLKPGFQATEDIYTYFRKFGKLVDKRRENVAPRSKYPGNVDQPFQMAINSMQNDYVVTYLMLSSQDKFMFEEYFRGKVADTVKSRKKEDDEDSVGRYLHLATQQKVANGEDIYTITEDEIYNKIFHEVRQTLLFSVGKSQQYGRFWQEIEDGIKRTKSQVGAPFEMGGVKFRFEYDKKQEVNIQGLRDVYSKSLYDSTLAHVTGVYTAKAAKFESIYNNLAALDTELTKGDTTEFMNAVKKLSSEEMDLLMLESPIIMQAYSSYLKHMEASLAFSGNILTPDMLSRFSYGKVEMDKLIEEDLKATHKMTDEEREVYIKLGKALTIASGDLIKTLMRGLPPLDTIFEGFADTPEGKAILAKRAAGEPLSVMELKEFSKRLKYSFHDHPYKGMLIAINPLKWIDAWADEIDSDTHHHLLSYVPVEVGGKPLSTYEMFTISQRVKDSIYYGVTDETQKYFAESQYVIPMLEIDNLSPGLTPSIAQRGGWSNQAGIILRRDVAFVPTNEPVLDDEGKQQKDHEGKPKFKPSNTIDGDKTFEKLLEKSPMLADQFMRAGAISGTEAEVKWSGDMKDKKKRVAYYSKKLMDYVYERNPSMFMIKEMRMNFRRDELSFNERVKQLTLDDGADMTQGFWKFLSSRESQDTFAEHIQPSKLSPEKQADMIRASNVMQRMTQVIMAAETGIRNEHMKISLKQYIEAVQKGLETGEKPTIVGHQEEFDRLHEIIAHEKKGEVARMRDLYGCQGSIDDLNKEFVRFAGKVFYDDDSIYNKAKFKGIYAKSTDSEDKSMSIHDYYARLIATDKMPTPFDWTYLNDANMAFQRTGLQILRRRLSDFGGYIKCTEAYGKAKTAQKDAIRLGNREETVKKLKGVIDEFGKAVPAISTSYGEADARRIGYVAMSYLQRPFLAHEAGDIPILGSLMPGMDSWATMMNPDDRLKQGILHLEHRRELMQYAYEKPHSESMLSGRKRDMQFADMDPVLFRIPIPFTKDEKKGGARKTKEVRIPKFVLDVFPRLAIRLKKLTKPGDVDFSWSSLLKQVRAETWRAVSTSIFAATVLGTLWLAFTAANEARKSELEAKS